MKNIKSLVQILTDNNIYLDSSKWQYYTDKELHFNGGGHKYCSTFYDFELLKYKFIPEIKILEVGVLRGSSMCLWNEYFISPIIIGLDIINRTSENPEFLEKSKTFFNTTIHLLDGYSEENSKIFDLFDIILDDGSHTVEDQCKFLSIWVDHLSIRGVLIIEDIQSIDYISIFISLIDSTKFKYKIVDTRSQTNIPDNILFVVNRI